MKGVSAEASSSRRRRVSEALWSTQEPDEGPGARYSAQMLSYHPIGFRDETREGTMINFPWFSVVDVTWRLHFKLQHFASPILCHILIKSRPGCTPLTSKSP